MTKRSEFLNNINIMLDEIVTASALNNYEDIKNILIELVPSLYIWKVNPDLIIELYSNSGRGEVVLKNITEKIRKEMDII